METPHQEPPPSSGWRGTAPAGPPCLPDRLLTGVSATAPLTSGAVALALGGVAVLACWVPAQRAVRVAPITSLRAE